MFNDWFSIGPLTVHGYGVMIAVGILAASWLAAKLCKEYKLDYENIDSFIIFVIVIGYAFSKLTYCLTVFDQFLKIINELPLFTFAPDQSCKQAS